MQTVTREELKQQIDAKAPVTIVEALPEQYYNEGHIPGAVMIPSDRVQELAPQLLKNKDGKIVTYCGGPSCDASTKTAEALKSLGYTNVAEYKGGKEEWKAAGLPFEAGKGEKAAGACSTDDKKAGGCGCG